MSSQVTCNKRAWCILLAMVFVIASAVADAPVVKARKRSETEMTDAARPKMDIQKRPFENKEVMNMPFYVFNNRILPPVQNFALSGFMGDADDLKVAGSYDQVFAEGYPTLKIEYGGRGKTGWASGLWQNPANNWGEYDGGYNLSKARKLSFWACGEKGGEAVEFILGGTSANFADSDSLSSGEIILSGEWTRYIIDLTAAKLSYISAGFGFVVKEDSNPTGCTFFLDDIRYEE